MKRKRRYRSTCHGGGEEEDFTFPDDPRWQEVVRLEQTIKEKKRQACTYSSPTEENHDTTIVEKSHTTETEKGATISDCMSKETKERLRKAFEQLQGNSEIVAIKDFLDFAKKENIVPRETSISQFNRGYVDRSGLFDHCQQWDELKLHFAPKEDMFDFISFGYNNNGKRMYPESILGELKDMAMEEPWDFKGSEGKLEILDYYFYTTLYRLRKEGKIIESGDKRYAAFDTGLVTSNYHPIYCLLEAKPRSKQPWMFKGFCTKGQGKVARLYSDNISEDPKPANYLHDQGIGFLYDSSKRVSLDYNHIIIIAVR